MDTILEALRELNAGVKKVPQKNQIKKRKLKESIESSVPVTLLGDSTVIDYITNNIKRGTWVHVGYMTEIIPAAKFRGGRNSVGNPMVRIFKFLEYYGRCGIDHENKQDVKAYRAETNTEHQSTWYTIDETGKMFIGKSNGKKGICIYSQKGKKPKVKFYISLDGEDLRPATRDEVASYLTPADAQKLLNPSSVGNSYVTAAGEVKDKPDAPNCLYASNIYWIGTDSHGKIGNSIFVNENLATDGKRKDVLIEGLFDQVYCTLTDGGDNRVYEICGKGFYPVDDIKTSYNAIYDIIIIERGNFQKAEEVAKKFELKFENVTRFGKNVFYVYVPIDGEIRYDFIPEKYKNRVAYENGDMSEEEYKASKRARRASRF